MAEVKVENMGLAKFERSPARGHHDWRHLRDIPGLWCQSAVGILPPSVQTYLIRLLSEIISSLTASLRLQALVFRLHDATRDQEFPRKGGSG